jgi:hypothetical protein
MREEHREAVQRMLEFIDEHLGKPITLYQLAQAAQYSPWHSARMFKEATGMAPFTWMPENLRRIGTGEYMQGVEVPKDFAGSVPKGYDLIDLLACQMMIFQGPPFEDEDYEEAIAGLWDVMKKYDPTFFGFAWADEDGPRFQMEPLGYRGYIEARPCKRI